MQPRFLELAEVLRIHEDPIERYGGAMAIRDVGLLLSALAQPRAAFGGKWLHENLHEMAAAYLFHIAQNRPFVDGSKRTGLAASLVFLLLNEIEVCAEEDEAVELVLGVARGEIKKPQIASFLRRDSA